jgi:catechol 2,3-dioxygenase-like lactoylglutathione lyase family enzyme
MPTDTENVRLSGKTGRDWRTAKTALLTPLRTRGARVHCPTMPQHIGYIALLVRDYDEAICYFVEKLGFTVAEDTDHGGGKRWVLVAPPGSVETRLVLAKAVSADELARVGNQTGGRVFLFLHTDDFSRDYQAYRSSGVLFREEPREEQYGVVAVFEDLYGNRWDLLELKR